MKKVLVTGATGFIGSYLVRHLNEQGVAVRIYRRPQSSLERLQDCRFEDFQGEINDWSRLEKAISNCDTLFHLAASTSFLNRDKKIRWEVNVFFLKRLLDRLLFKQDNIRFLYVSSAGAVGLSKQPQVFNEESPFDCLGIDYFLSKRKAEESVLEAVRKGLDAVVVNPATVIGGEMRQSQRTALQRLAEKRYFFFPPGGTSIAFVSDVCQGMIQAAIHGKQGERYILGGHNLSYQDYFKTAASFFGTQPLAIPLPGFFLPLFGWCLEYLRGRYGKDAGVLANSFGYYSSAKAARELGYSMTPLQQILESLC